MLLVTCVLWLQTFAPQRYRPNYSNRRVWRVFSKFAPSLNLQPSNNADASPYPFSVPVDRDHLVSAVDLMNIQRDHYEGTQFDMTQGLAAGPYGDPNRYDLSLVDNMTITDLMSGEFGRAISLFRTSYSFVAQGRANKPNELALVWFAPYAPDVSSYTPVYVNADKLPSSLISGSMHVSVTTFTFCSISYYLCCVEILN
jgi:dipeptidase